MVSCTENVVGLSIFFFFFFFFVGIYLLSSISTSLKACEFLPVEVEQFSLANSLCSGPITDRS